MKALFEHVNEEKESSVHLIQLNRRSFNKLFHFHPELELTYIIKSFGKRYLGGVIKDYYPGDLVLVGKNVPHCWISMDEPKEESAQAIVIQLNYKLFEASILNLPEFKHIQKLINAGDTGILITGNARTKIIEKIGYCKNTSGLNRLLLILDIFEIIAVTDEKEIIDPGFKYNPSSAEAERIKIIYSFLMDNFKNDISLKNISEVIHMAPTSFCRYFKNTTHKTLFQVISEIRLNHACQLLINTEKPITEICFESGFGNISYFNKTFKKFTTYTPLHYRKLFAK